MGEYVITIALMTVLSALMMLLAPERWEKHISLVTGLIITICIARPVIALVGGELTEEMPPVRVSVTKGDAILSNEIKKELESRISMDVKERLKREFDRECVARVTVTKDTEGKISGVGTIHIRGEKPDGVAIGRLREIYGASEVKYLGP